MHHHPPKKTGDIHHSVSLTSSTLGSLKLDPSIQNHAENKESSDPPLNQNQSPEEKIRAPTEIGEKIERKKSSAKEEFELGMIEAKTWSTMINDKIPKPCPKTPIRTPPGEPETIDVSEMMEGLEDISPIRPNRFRSFSFHMSSHTSFSHLDDQDHLTPRVKESGNASPKPMWLDLADSDSNSNSNDTSIVSEFDPEVIATFRRALEELPSANPFHLKGEKQADENDIVAKIGTEKLVVYFTSLRGVRKTYEDCCHVRVILKGLGVRVDERDVSMHSGFKEELKGLLGEGFVGLGLPRVFLGNKCIGGADEIRRLNEEGKLEKLVENCEFVDDGGEGGGGNGNVCEACGDLRFVPCDTCSGSCKIYYEDEEEECDESDHEYGFHRCPDCNENGLIRCPICCD